jgi:hypoxanthine phosphoribosyltransferase
MVEMCSTHKEVVHFTIEDMFLAINYFIKEIKNNDIEKIYAIPRGGLILGQILSNRLNLPLILDEKLIDEKTVICDDICDTGTTLFKFPYNKKLVFCTKSKGLNIIYNLIFYKQYKNTDWVKFWWE